MRFVHAVVGLWFGSSAFVVGGKLPGGGVVPVPPTKAHPTTVRAKLPCVVAAEWVDANKLFLPKHLAELSGYGRLYRKAIYRVLPKKTQAALWHEQLAYYLNDAGLSAQQKSFIRNADAALDSVLATPHDMQAIHAFNATAQLLFGFTRAREMFADLGVNTPEVRQGGPLDPKEASVTGGCGCSRQSDWCNPAGNGCVNSPCTGTITGCGTWWDYGCDGICLG